MRARGMRVIRGGAACCLALVVFLAGGAARAGLVGSRHDLATGPYGYPAITPMGSCSGCHIPHFGVSGSEIWSRSLTEETGAFSQTANPNYVPGKTLLCYDCHNDAPSGSAPHFSDNDPSASWNTHPPQNTAFTDDGPSPTNPTQVGYYERIDGTYGAGPTDGSATGGHYWKSEPGGSPDLFRQGDKIACEMCHDPHDANTGSNDVFFRLSTDNGSGSTVSLTRYETDHRASPSAHDETPGGTGRTMCAECHTYSNDSTTVARLYGVDVPKPPTVIPQHVSSDTTPCVDCHAHNKVTASCRECHGYPPLETTAQAGGTFHKTDRPDAESYAGGAGAHQRHLDALGADIFKCQICHGPNPGSASWHNDGLGAVSQGQVDVMGQSAIWDPNSTATTKGYTGTASGETLPSGYEFVAKGGGDQRCSGLACHGEPPNTVGALNWTDDLADGDTPYDNPNAGDVKICKWCHDGTPAVIDFGAGLVTARNVLGNGNDVTVAWSDASWGADKNGHGLAAGSRYDTTALDSANGANGAAKECTACHDATYTGAVPNGTHYDGVYLSAEKRLLGTINGQTVTNPDGACTACHQNAGGDAGAQVSHHGNSTAGGYVPLEGAFSRVCRQCHDVHGANWNGASRNLAMIGKWLDPDHDGVGDAGEAAHVDSNATNSTADVTAADNAVVFTARSGADSFDADDVTPNNNICYTCHAPVTTPPTGTGGGQHNGTPGMSDERGNDCLQCHDHDFDDTVASADAFMPSGCTGCHGEGGNVHQGINGGAGDDAPNVMTLNVGGTWRSVWDGEWWDTQMGGGNVQQGGHGDPDGRAAVECTGCHNTGSPQPNTHLNGVHESAGDTAAPSGANANTAHLKPEFFTKYEPSSPGPYSVQVAMDGYCYQECHASAGVRNHRHEQDSWGPDGRQGTADDILTVPPRNVMELGTHLSSTVPVAVAPRTWRLAMDSDLNVNASGGASTPNYAPCISCHNSHGTTISDTKRSSNKMVRDLFSSPPSPLCLACHP